MTFQATILECLQRLQKEILTRGSELSAEELWCVFNGEAIESSRRIEEGTEERTEETRERERPKKKIFKKKKRQPMDVEPEVEMWRQGRYGKLYLKCIKTGRLYDPNTEELVGLYHFNSDTELETITLYDN